MSENKATFFLNNLEYIDGNGILSLVERIKNKNISLIEEEPEKLLPDSLLPSKNPTTNSLKIEYKMRYPLYNNGSFKEDIDNFLNQSINKPIEILFNQIENEISKIYLCYITVEDTIYNKITSLINFCEKKEEFSKLQIISRIKEISEILEESYKFITNYLFYNLSILKNILENIDNELTSQFNVRSLSIIFLLKYFDKPNNELGYILMFKIFDEETLVLNYILNKLKENVEINNNSIVNNIIYSLDDNKKLTNRESRIFSDETEDDKNETLNAMIDLMNDYIARSYNTIKNINNIDSYRVLYNNYFIFIRGNINIDNNDRSLYNSVVSNETSSNDSELNEYMAINSLMDEELIIKNFLNKEIINNFIDFFKSKLPLNYKIDKFLIYIHYMQYYTIPSIIIFWYKNNNQIKDICLYMISYSIGLFFSKILNSFLISKNISIKTIIIINNILLVISLFLIFVDLTQIINDSYLLLINRFLIGLSYSNNIETKFLISYEPKLLVMETVHSFYGLKYISIFIAIIFISLINIFNEKIKLDFFSNISFLNMNSINENKHEFFFFGISFIIFIINIVLYRNIKYKDIIKMNNSSENILIKSDNKEISKSVNSNANNDFCNRSVISYGKTKLISYKNKKKANYIDYNLKKYENKDNYEGKNQIFIELNNLIYNENTCLSDINKITFGFLLLLNITAINSQILLFIIPFRISEENSNPKIYYIIFSLSYLVGYFSFKFKKSFIKSSNDKINYMNIFILVILFATIIFYFFLLFIIYFNKNDYALGICSILISLLNINIEIFITYLMSMIIPIEKKVLKTNINKFLDINIILIRPFIFLLIYLIKNAFQNELIINDIILFTISCVLSIFGTFIYIIFNYNINYTSLARIMNKISYEK